MSYICSFNNIFYLWEYKSVKKFIITLTFCSTTKHPWLINSLNFRIYNSQLIKWRGKKNWHTNLLLQVKINFLTYDKSKSLYSCILSHISVAFVSFLTIWRFLSYTVFCLCIWAAPRNERRDPFDHIMTMQYGLIIPSRNFVFFFSFLFPNS